VLLALLAEQWPCNLTEGSKSHLRQSFYAIQFTHRFLAVRFSHNRAVATGTVGSVSIGPLFGPAKIFFSLLATYFEAFRSAKSSAGSSRRHPRPQLALGHAPPVDSTRSRYRVLDSIVPEIWVRAHMPRPRPTYNDTMHIAHARLLATPPPHVSAILLNARAYAGVCNGHEQLKGDSSKSS